MKRGGGLHPARPDWWPPTKRPRATPGGLRVFFGSTLCPIFALNRGFSSNKRFRMVNYNFRGSFDHCAPTCMGSPLPMARFWSVKGNLSEKPVILKTINRLNRLFCKNYRLKPVIFKNTSFQNLRSARMNRVAAGGPSVQKATHRGQQGQQEVPSRNVVQRRVVPAAAVASPVAGCRDCGEGQRWS